MPTPTHNWDENSVACERELLMTAAIGNLVGSRATVGKLGLPASIFKRMPTLASSGAHYPYKHADWLFLSSLILLPNTATDINSSVEFLSKDPQILYMFTTFTVQMCFFYVFPIISTKISYHLPTLRGNCCFNLSYIRVTWLVQRDLKRKRLFILV